MKTLLGQDRGNSGIVSITAADVVTSPSAGKPAMKSFEELEIPANFRAVAEKELSADEKIVWIGRPSRNRQVHPQQKGVVYVGFGLIAVAVCIAGSALAMGAIFPLVFASRVDARPDEDPDREIRLRHP